MTPNEKKGPGPDDREPPFARHARVYFALKIAVLALAVVLALKALGTW